MTNSDAPAAGQSGTVPQSQDETNRQSVAASLAAAMAEGMSFLALCRKAADDAYPDRVGAIEGAAKVMNAKARLAMAFARVAQVENRNRTIVEQIQPPDRRQEELISGIEQAKADDDARARLQAKLDELLARRSAATP